MLIGEYTHTIDNKNRLSLPSKFRKEMGKQLVITPGLDSCLFIFTKKEWSHISEKLGEFSMLQANNRSFTRFMFGGATEVEVDTSGRVLIPDFLRSRISLKNKAALVGVKNRIEVWDEKTWEKYKTGAEKEVDDLAEKLGGIGIL